VAREGSALSALACFCMPMASSAAVIPENSCRASILVQFATVSPFGTYSRSDFRLALASFSLENPSVYVLPPKLIDPDCACNADTKSGLKRMSVLKRIDSRSPQPKDVTKWRMACEKNLISPVFQEPRAKPDAFPGFVFLKEYTR